MGENTDCKGSRGAEYLELTSNQKTMLATVMMKGISKSLADEINAYSQQLNAQSSY